MYWGYGDREEAGYTVTARLNPVPLSIGIHLYLSQAPWRLHLKV